MSEQQDIVVVVENEQDIIVVDDGDSTVNIPEAGIPGPPGPIVPGLELNYRVDFGHTAQQTVLQDLHAGDGLVEVRVRVKVPFNDPLAYITVGTDADPELFMGAVDNKLQGTGEYLIDYETEIDEDISIKLFLFSVATVGEGTVSIAVIKN